MQRVLQNNNRLSIKKDTVAKLLKTFDEKFKIVIFTQNDQLLGKGSYGKCYLGILKNQQTSILFNEQQKNSDIDIKDERIKHNLVVVKQIKKDIKNLGQQELYKKQIQNLSAATQVPGYQENIVRCFPFSFSSENYYYLVMEYCQGKSLDRLMNKRAKSGSSFNFFQFLKIFSDVINGYYTLRKLNIIHEDLKPENIFIKGKNFKIGDFGLSFVAHKYNKFGRGGSQSYNGIQKYSQQGQVSYKSDIYAIGVILYKLFYGIHPYYERIQWENYKIQEIEKLQRLTNQRIRLNRRDQIKLFVRFYEKRTLKQRNPQVYMVQTSQQFKNRYGELISSIYDRKIPQLINFMISKNINDRASFKEIKKFLSQHRVSEILKYVQQSQTISELKLPFFDELNVQVQDNIYLPCQFSQIGQKITFQEESDIQRQQIIMQNTLLKVSSHNRERQRLKIKKFPRVYALKSMIEKINIVSRFLMQVYQQFSLLDFNNIFKKQQERKRRQQSQNQKNYYEEKKIFLEFAIQKYLLSFLTYIKSKVEIQSNLLSQQQLKTYYKQNIDLMAKIIDKNKQFLQSELFLVEEDVKDFQKNENDLQETIHKQFLVDISLDEKNIELSYYSITILRIKEQIKRIIQKFSIQNERVVQSQIYQILTESRRQQAKGIKEIREQWGQIMQLSVEINKKGQSNGDNIKKEQKMQKEGKRSVQELRRELESKLKRRVEGYLKQHKIEYMLNFDEE